MKPIRIHGLPLHPMLVHFPVAAWSVATILALLAVLGVGVSDGDGVGGNLQELAFQANAFGLATGIAAMLAGMIELAGLPSNAALRDTVVRHLLLAVSAWFGFGLMLVLQVKSHPELAALAGIVSMAVLVAAGHAGARVVYHHGYPSKPDT